MTDSSDALAGAPATSYLSPRVRQYADHAKAANTRRAYRIDWDDFVGWCKFYTAALRFRRSPRPSLSIW